MNRSTRRNRKYRVVRNSMGKSRYYAAGDVILVVKNNTIVTVMRRDWR